MSDTNAQTLDGVDLLDELGEPERRKIEQSCRWKRYATHEQIIDRQSETRDVFFVITGKVRVVNYSMSGREITLDDIQTGGYFGELAAIDNQPRSASVMALTDCLVASLAADQFLAVCAGHPEIAKKLMGRLAAIIRTSTDRIMDLSTLAANNRVHADLLRQARSNMRGKNEAAISPIPLHGDIASRVSTTRETVARVMNDLARQGIVKRTKDSLVINDLERLKHMVEDVRGA